MRWSSITLYSALNESESRSGPGSEDSLPNPYLRYRDPTFTGASGDAVQFLDPQQKQNPLSLSQSYSAPPLFRRLKRTRTIFLCGSTFIWLALVVYAGSRDSSDVSSSLSSST